MTKLQRRAIQSAVILAVIAGAASIWLCDKYVVPIVMYHKVEDSQSLKSDTVSPKNFQKQMAYLKRNGYRILSLNELVALTEAGQALPRKAVVLTFDDGYENNFTYALPVLKEHHFPAMVFVAPEFIGKEGFLNWQQLKVMKDAGIDFGSHGMTQAYLPDLTDEKRAAEIEQSKEVLEEELKVPVEYFSYPVGGFSDDIKQELRMAGYRAALATNRGHDRFNKDVYELNRIRLSDKDNSDFVIWAKLSGYYNLFRKLKNPN